MIDICTSGAKHTMDRIKQYSSSPTGIFLYSLVTGIVGIIILLTFFSMLFAGSMLTLILPVIVGFNSAAGGYGFVDKRGSDTPYQKLPLFGIAVLLAITGCFFITFIIPWEPLLDGWRYLITTTSALFSTFFGAWLAVKTRRQPRGHHNKPTYQEEV